MRGQGEEQVKEAMRTLLTPAIASRHLLQFTPEDVTIVTPYSDNVVAEWVVEGNNPKELDELLGKIENQGPMAGTYTHKALLQALGKAKSFAYRQVPHVGHPDERRRSHRLTPGVLPDHR